MFTWGAKIHFSETERDQVTVFSTDLHLGMTNSQLYPMMTYISWLTAVRQKHHLIFCLGQIASTTKGIIILLDTDLHSGKQQEAVNHI